MAHRTGASSFTKLIFHSLYRHVFLYSCECESDQQREEWVSPGSQQAEKSDTALQESQTLMSCQDPSPTSSFTSQ